jgi:hypothetical protein
MERPLSPLGPEELPDDLRALLSAAGEQMGFKPSDVLMMANWPELLRAMAALVFTVWRPGEVSMELKRLVGLFGFLNRWNATLRSPLEAEPAAVAHRLLGARGWSPGVHDAVD